MADTKSQSNLEAFGVDICDPYQTVSVFTDHKRAAWSVDRLMLIIILVVIPTLLTMRDLPPDDPIFQFFGIPMIVVLVLGLVGYVVCRSRLLLNRCTEPILKIERDGITFRSESFQFNLLRWEELGEVSSRRMSTPSNKYVPILPFLGRLHGKIAGESLDLRPVNPNTLYQLAVDEKTKNLLGKLAKMKNRMPHMQSVQEISPILIHESGLPFPLTPADLLLLINTRKKLALDSREKIPRLELSVQELAPVEEKPSVIEIKRKIKLRKKAESRVP